jgi:hypothetical protein
MTLLLERCWLGVVSDVLLSWWLSWLHHQGRALSELRSLEESSAALASAIQEGQLAKRQLLDDMIEAERQIMLTERKLQLEKEMQVGCVVSPGHLHQASARSIMIAAAAGKWHQLLISACICCCCCSLERLGGLCCVC